MRRSLLALMLLCVLIGGATQAQEGHGVVRMVYSIGGASERPETAWDGCTHTACWAAARLLAPALFAYDPATGMVRPAEAGERVLIATPPILPQGEQRYSIREDMLWSDGAPISAYDVAFNIIGRELEAAQPLRIIDGFRIDDARTFTVVYRQPDCTSQARRNTLVIPSSSAVARFQDFAKDFMETSRHIPSLIEWSEAYQQYFDGQAWPPQGGAPPTDVSRLPWGGDFTTRLGSVGLQAAATDLVIETQYLNNPDPTLTFMRSDANLFLDPPFADRADLRRLGDIQLYAAPGYAVDRLVFNLSDPYYPRAAFVDGKPLEQVPNPILFDARVRRAIRLAIDVQALIDVGLFGGGVALNGAYSPASWAYDPTLPAWEYNPQEAERLLHEAGWRGDERRECRGCAYPERRNALVLRLMVDGDPIRERVAEVLATQLRQVGIGVELAYSDGSAQDYDLLLTGTSGASLWSREPDLSYQFAPETDVLYTGNTNTGSAADPELMGLLEDARRTPTCSITERAKVYREVQRHLNETLPATWLYARDDFYAARGIVNFDPLPGEPLWNILDWVVTR